MWGHSRLPSADLGNGRYISRRNVVPTMCLCFSRALRPCFNRFTRNRLEPYPSKYVSMQSFQPLAMRSTSAILVRTLSTACLLELELPQGVEAGKDRDFKGSARAQDASESGLDVRRRFKRC